MVGTNEDDAVLRVNDKIRANLDRIPIGIQPPLIVGHGIDDVAIVSLTLAPTPEAAAHWNPADLDQLGRKLQGELLKVPDVGLSYISGADPQQIRVEPDPEKLMLFGVTLQQLAAKVRDANRSFVAGTVRDGGVMRSVAAGQTLFGVPDIGLLLLTTRDGRPVYVRDVARVTVGAAPVESSVWDIAPHGGAGCHAGPGKNRGRQRRGRFEGHPEPCGGVERIADSGRHRCPRHAGLRSDRKR
jgi:multidrug efflux pump subunit AcrB